VEYFYRFPPHIDHAALQDIFDEEELTTLNDYHFASAMDYELMLAKWGCKIRDMMSDIKEAKSVLTAYSI
tara:strand:- start:47 stop:256 length:210 start_codon:yes stop_codon:yes gene_type:complete